MSYDVECALSTSGSDLLLHVLPYELEKAFGDKKAVSFRKVEAANRWVEGSVPTSAVKENVSYPMSVYIGGADHAELDQAVRALEAALSQKTFTATVTELDNGLATVTTTYTCFAANYAVETTLEYRYATLALVKAEVPTLPSPVVVYP